MMVLVWHFCNHFLLTCYVIICYKMVEPWHVSVTWIIRVWLFMKSEFYSWINPCFDARPCKHYPHLSVDHHWGFYSTFHGTILRSKSCTWSFTSLGGVNTQLQNHLLHLSLDVLMTAHVSSRIGNQDSTPSEYWQSIPQRCSYMGLMSLEYFNISPGGQGQKIIPDAVMSWICTVTWNLKALALMDVIWLVYQV